MIESFKKLHDIIESHQLTLHQLFNCVEMGLFWCMLLNKTLADSTEKTARNFKEPKERITLLATTNASGDFRMPLLMVGKSKNPRALQNINRSALPFMYTHQSKAWIDTPTFISWFHEQFIPKFTAYLQVKGLSPKALLLLDNALSHPDSSLLQFSDGNIKCIYLPPNTTSLCQPMDQGVFENLKRRYKRLLLENLILSMENTPPESFLKQLTIKDCIYMAAKAWEDIRP